MQPCHGCDSDSNSELGAKFFFDFSVLLSVIFGYGLDLRFYLFDIRFAVFDFRFRFVLFRRSSFAVPTFRVLRE